MTLYLLLSLFFLLLLLLHHRVKKYIPILMYHRIANIPNDRNALPPEKFKQQLDYLAKHGFTTLSLAELHKHHQQNIPLPPKAIMLTFDDGYEDNFTIALPLLKKHQMNAVVFPIANWIGKENKWENFNKQPTVTMDWDKLIMWQKAGLDIASHTLEHPFLSHCTPQRLTKELVCSKAILENNLQQPITFLCYPYGDFDAKVIAAAKAAGYDGAFAIFDHVPIKNIDKYALPRVPIPASQKFWEFKLKVSKFFIVFVAMRKFERDIKRLLRKKAAAR